MVSTKVKSYVFDTYAVLAYFYNEKGSDTIERLLKAAETGEINIFLNEINLGEIYYRSWKDKGKRSATKALQLCFSLPLTLVAATQEFILKAAAIKAQNQVSYADAFCIETARAKKHPILTGDPEFAQVKGIKTLWIGEAQ